MTTSPEPTIPISTDDDHPVWADVYGIGEGAPGNRVVVLCHGMKGYRRWGFIPRLAEALCGDGITALAIDFSHNGVAGGDGGAGGGPVYPHADMIRRNTIDRERRDLAAVIAWIRTGGGGRFQPSARIGLWGHSRGGTSVVLNALAAPRDVAAIATWSAPAHADIYQPRQKARWREAGEYDWLEGESGQRLAMGICFLDDLEAHPDDYALADRSAGLEIPHLIVHGEIDLVIPPENARRFAEARTAGAETRLVLLRTGHTYGVGGSGNPGPLATAIDETTGWFRRHLSADGERK
jgi:dienelactone hydrolase